MADQPTIGVKFGVLSASAYLDYNSTVLNRSLSVVDSVSAADGLVMLNNKALLLTDVFSTTDGVVELVGGDLNQPASDTVTATDAAAKAFNSGRSDTVTGTDALAKAVSIVKADTFTVADAVLLDHGILLADTMSAGDSLTAVIPLSAWNPSDEVNAALSAGNRKMTVDNSGLSGGARATTGRNTGKFYFAITADVIVGSGSEGAGIKLSGGSPNNANGTFANEAGWSFNSVVFQANGSVVSAAGVTPVNGDVVGFAVDLDAGQWFAQLNGTWLRGGNPVTGAGAFGGITAGATYFPSASGHEGTSATFVSGTPPSGYTSWN